MTGFGMMTARKWPLSLALIGAMGLAACDENGEFAFPGASNAAPSAPLPANALNQRVQRDVDIERPDIFSVTDDGLWDGRPSLGGVWVAHPDVFDPDRVVIRNTETGREIVGALFRRERENPGPLLQVSSDAAEALGMLPGAPTQLEVVVLRREVVEEPQEPEVNPVVAGLDAPVAVEEAPLEPAETVSDDDAGSAAGAAATAAAAVVLPPALEAATAAAEQTAAAATAETATAAEAPIDVSSVLESTAPLPDGAQAQIGVFSVEANANAAVETITAAGIGAQVLPEELGGRTVWRVVAGPLTDTGQIARLKDMGFVDAFVIEGAE